MSENDSNLYETTSFRTLGWIGAIMFTLGPPVFLYEWWLTFYTTAVEENPAIGPMMMIACFATFASVPLMIAGRRKRLSPSPTVHALPAKLPSFRRREPAIGMRMEPGQAPL